MADLPQWDRPVIDVETHRVDTTDVHGIPDTADVALESRLPVNVRERGAVGDGVADDTAAVQAAIDAAAGGLVLFPKGTYAVRELRAPDRTVLQGIGRGSVLKWRGDSTGQGNNVFAVAAGENNRRIWIRDLEFRGPDSYAGINDYVLGVHVNATGTRLYVERCTFVGLSYGVFANNPLADAELHVSDCRFEGQAATRASVGIAHYGDSGELRVRDCHVFDQGGTFAHSGAQGHSIDCRNSVRVDIARCRLGRVFGANGRGFNQSTGAAAAYTRLRDCHFEPDQAFALQTSTVTPTLVDGCVFDVPADAIWLNGCPVQVRGCRFINQAAIGDQQIFVGGAAAVGLIEGCVFATNGGNLIAILINAGADLAIRDCRFDDATDYGVDLGGGAGGARVTVDACSFTGPTDYAIRCRAAATLNVTANRFANPGGGLLFNTNIATRFRLAGNDLSQTNAGGQSSVTFTTTPATFEAEDNGGTQGYRSRNGGIIEVANGNQIAHGLGSASAPITPTRFGICPMTAARIATFTGRDATNLNAGLHDHAGAAIAVAEFVSWWAEK